MKMQNIGKFTKLLAKVVHMLGSENFRSSNYGTG